MWEMQQNTRSKNYYIIPQGGFYFYLDFQELVDTFREKGLLTSNQLSIAMLEHPHHIATVTGDAVMLPPDIFGARIAFVDYDGGRAYNYYRNKPPATEVEEEEGVLEGLAWKKLPSSNNDL